MKALVKRWRDKAATFKLKATAYRYDDDPTNAERCEGAADALEACAEQAEALLK